MPSLPPLPLPPSPATSLAVIEHLSYEYSKHLYAAPRVQVYSTMLEIRIAQHEAGTKDLTLAKRRQMVRRHLCHDSIHVVLAPPLLPRFTAAPVRCD